MNERRSFREWILAALLLPLALAVLLPVVFLFAIFLYLSACWYALAALYRYLFGARAVPTWSGPHYVDASVRVENTSEQKR
jgi:hypothetical protein